MFKLALLLLLVPLGCWAGDLDCDEPDTLEGPLFVSLGSYCEPAHMLRFCDLRKAAFPFDWIVSFDGEALIDLLNNNFADFLNPEKLVAHDRGGALLHTGYHLEFLHDGDWRGSGYASNMESFQSKYQRRIERFRSLNSHKGHVFFIRSSFLYSTTDPHRFFKSPENLNITKDYAQRLYRALQTFFPDLLFTLIIVNENQQSNPSIVWERTDNPHLIFAKRRTAQEDHRNNIPYFRSFFNHLLLSFKNP